MQSSSTEHDCPKTDLFLCQDEKQFVAVEEFRYKPLRQTIRRRSWQSGLIVDEADCPVTDAGCAIDKIAASPSGIWVVTRRSSGQGQWGYDVFRSCPLERVAGIPQERGYMLELPKFSADEIRLVGGFGRHWLGGWWAHPDDELEDPARGGLVSFGFLLIHYLPSHQVERHELQMDLPRGWLPEDQDADIWMGAFGITPGIDSISLTLPGGVGFEIEGRLPPVILLPTPHPSGGRLL